MKYTPFILLILAGCGQLQNSFGVNQDYGKAQTATQREEFTVANKTNLDTVTQPPFINISGSGNITVSGLPDPATLRQNIVKQSEKKQSSSQSFMDMSMTELWKTESSWFYLIGAVAFVLFVIGLKWLESTKTFKAIEFGATIIGEQIEDIEQKLTSSTPGTKEFYQLQSQEKALMMQERALRKGKPRRRFGLF